MNSFANIRGILGVVMKKIFLLYLVARGDGGEKVLDALVYNDSRRFLGPPRKNKCWRATLLEGLVSTKRHGGNILLIYISFLTTYHSIRVFNKSVGIGSSSVFRYATPFFKFKL
jgi:hypothetical protein